MVIIHSFLYVYQRVLRFWKELYLLVCTFLYGHRDAQGMIDIAVPVPLSLVVSCLIEADSLPTFHHLIYRFINLYTVYGFV